MTCLADVMRPCINAIDGRTQHVVLVPQNQFNRILFLGLADVTRQADAAVDQCLDCRICYNRIEKCECYFKLDQTNKKINIKEYRIK